MDEGDRVETVIPPAAMAWIDLEKRANVAEERNIELEKNLAVLENELAHWRTRCTDAEHKRDHYARYAVELLTRIAGLKTDAERLIGDVTELVEEAKHAAYRANGSVPAPQVQLRPEDQKRVENLAQKLAPRGDDEYNN